ncbi:anti-sigma factor [Bremerella sp. T1]|uniref:hypothetical protein n=1 Tax=Bremerella sp. TYQ1 TaxID=3119568 RepID=UPI001CCAF475|nr:hypothetical protein [Bremerella volcania]UBM36790.1 hypothetical protein LA756_02565 [Bremerella volcania]
MKLTCKELYEFMGDYLEGNLPDDVMCVMKTHISRCPCCEHYLENYRTAMRLGVSCCKEYAEDEVPTSVPEPLVQAILEARKKSQ